VSEKPEECECCKFKTSELKKYHSDNNWPQERDNVKWLCDLCANTHTGSFNEYPQQHDRDSLCVMKTVCYVGNAIIAAIRTTK